MMVIQTYTRSLGEFLDFVAAPENEDQLFELIYGEIIEVCQPDEHTTH